MKLKVLFFVGVWALYSVYNSVEAFQFVPTEEEWNRWTLRCKALYVSIPIAQTTDFYHRVSKADAQHYYELARKSKGGPWHYCEGLARYSRYKSPKNSKDVREHELEKAFKAVRYTILNFNKEDPWYAEMATQMGNILTDKGEYDEAVKYYDSAIQYHPDYFAAALSKSMLYRKTGSIEKAISTLKVLGDGKNLKYAEVYYALGLYSLENNQLEEAKRYADLSYGMGYPLPGLQNKIKEATFND